MECVHKSNVDLCQIKTQNMVEIWFPALFIKLLHKLNSPASVARQQVYYRNKYIAKAFLVLWRMNDFFFSPFFFP